MSAMKTKKLLESFEKNCASIAEAFSQYMWGEPLNEDCSFISNDCTGTMEIGDTYWSLSDMYDILKNQYPRDVVMAHYDYSVMFSGENREYYLNRGTFAKMYDGKTPIEEWAKKHHEEVDKNRAYWESPE